MTTINKKKPKEIEKEIKGKLIQVIESSLFAKNDADKKVKKVIKNAASEIAKKFLKSLKKNEKKISKVEKPTSKKAKIVKKKAQPKKDQSKVSSNGKSTPKPELS